MDVILMMHLERGLFFKGADLEKEAFLQREEPIRTQTLCKSRGLGDRHTESARSSLLGLYEMKPLENINRLD